MHFLKAFFVVFHSLVSKFNKLTCLLIRNEGKVKAEG
jgi:hypothetical protein